MKEGRREAAMFLIIYLTSRAAVWIRWPCLLLVFIRRSEITLFFFPRDIIFHPGLFLHGMRLLATVHANQKLWFMHLSCGGLNIKFNFAAVEPCLPRAEAWHGELGLPELRGNSLLPPQYAKATFEWNICLMSERSSVYALYTDTWERGGGGEGAHTRL